jgi:hypothetical protein
MENRVVLSVPGIKMVRTSYLRRRVSPSETTTLLGPNANPFGEPLGRHRERQWLFSGITYVHTSQLLFEASCSDEEEGRTEKESTAHANSGGASFLQRRFCGFAKSGKLRDLEASERFARGSGKIRIRPNSSQPLAESQSNSSHHSGQA